MKPTRVPHCCLVAFSLVALAGCASQPSTSADLMRGHASDEQSQVDRKNQIAEDWDRAQELVESGNENVDAGLKKVKNAEEARTKGERQIERGNREITEGKELMADAMERFRAAFPDLDIAADE